MCGKKHVDWPVPGVSQEWSTATRRSDGAARDHRYAFDHEKRMHGWIGICGQGFWVRHPPMGSGRVRSSAIPAFAALQSQSRLCRSGAAHGGTKLVAKRLRWRLTTLGGSQCVRTPARLCAVPPRSIPGTIAMSISVEGDCLTLTVEHRAAPAPKSMKIELVETREVLAFELVGCSDFRRAPAWRQRSTPLLPDPLRRAGLQMPRPYRPLLRAPCRPYHYWPYRQAAVVIVSWDELRQRSLPASASRIPYSEDRRSVHVLRRSVGPLTRVVWNIAQRARVSQPSTGWRRCRDYAVSRSSGRPCANRADTDRTSVFGSLQSTA